MTGMTEYALTFGQRYRREPHPNYAPAHPDGWVTVAAPDYAAARALVVDRIGTAWCDLVPLNRLPRNLFPLGEIARWEVDPPEDREMTQALIGHALGLPTVVTNGGVYVYGATS